MALRRRDPEGVLPARSAMLGGVDEAFGTRLSRSPWRSAVVLARQNPTAAAGLVVLFAFCGIALVAPALVPYDPDNLNPFDRLQSPSTTHWFGTDSLGRDVLSLTM